MKRIIIVVFILLVVAGSVLVVRYPSVVRDILRGEGAFITAHLEGAEDIQMTDIARFRQDGAAWAQDVMGDTSDHLGDYGCTITSVTNAVSNITGVAMSPKVMNENLSRIGGYTSQGWLIWGKVAEATNGAAKVRVYDTPSHEAVAACMNDGAYPIVKIKLGGVVPHWVLLVGRTDGAYMMRDPLRGGVEDGAIAVQERSNKIYSLRCVTAG